MTLYLAYGSNLNVLQMAQRCPAAVPMNAIELPDARLVFRGVADVVYAKGESCPVGVWRITETCERALDRYEGVSSGLYRKEYVKLQVGPGDRVEHALIYQMNSERIAPPDAWYYGVIEEGYGHFEIDPAPLVEARRRSMERQPKRSSRSYVSPVAKRRGRHAVEA